MKAKSKKEILKLAEKYAKNQCESVKDTLPYSPAEIYHLIKTVWMDGYNKIEIGK
jgi:hypothetical protein